MGLNAKEIPLSLYKMIQASYNTSYKFVQRHPVVSGVFSFFLILYIFLSYIYSFLVYLSPFILCTAIFIRIFWSSEQPQLRYVKREKKRNEYKHPRVASKYGRNNFVLDGYYNYPSQYTSRRRNFREKKWGLHSGKNEFSNAVSERKTDSREASSVERSRESSSDHVMPTGKLVTPIRQTLRSEPSMSDLVCYGLGASKSSEDIRDDEDEESQDDRIKAVEWTVNDHKNIMDIGFSELERNTRMETLIANRRARKLLKMQMDKGLNTSDPAPVFITRNNNFEDFNGIDMPDSAPSIVRPSRNPFDPRCDPSKEGKPISHQDFTKGNQKDKTCSRHASFSVGRFRRFQDKGNHDWLIEQMFSKEGIFERDEGGLKSPIPQSNSKETDMADMKGKKVENAHSKDTVSVLKNRNNGFAEIDQNISSVQRAGVSEKPEPGVHNKSPEKLLNFSISNSTTINDSLFNSFASHIKKHQENIFYFQRRISKTPTYSVASDLQVEVSEVGSPTTLTHDGSNSSSDEESSVYDGDNEKDITSGSEDMWGNSIHSKEVRGVGDFEDIAEANSNKDILSTFPLQEIDEENSADVSSVSSTCDIPGDTPTGAVSDGYKIFCNMRDTALQNETAQPLNSSDLPSSRSHSEKKEDWCNLHENYIYEAQDVKDVNDSATIDKDHADNITSNKDPVPSTMQQESIDEVSVHSNSSFSSKSVLPKKTLTDEVSSSASGQQIHMQIPQSTKKEDTAKTTSTGQLHPEVKPHNMQPSINDPSPTVQLHNGDFNNPQTNRADEAKSDIEAKKNVQGNSANLAEKEVTNLTKPAAGMNNVNTPTGEKVPSNKEKEVESQPLMKPKSTAEPIINATTKDSISTNNSEGKHGDLKENEAIISSKSARESDKSRETAHSEEPKQVPQHEDVKPAKQNDSLEEASCFQSKSNKLVEDDMQKDKLTIGNNTRDLPQPVVTELGISRSAEDSEGKSDKVNMREAIEQGSNKIEAKFSYKSVGDSDKTISTARMGEDVKVPKPGKANDMAQTTAIGVLPPEGIAYNIQHLINDPIPTIQAHNGDLKNVQPYPAKEAKVDIEAKKDVQGNSTNLAENEVTNLTKTAAVKNSTNTPNGEKVPLNEENEGDSQTSMNQGPTEQPLISAKTKDSRSANGSEGKIDALNGTEAIVSSKSGKGSHKLSETAHSEEPGHVPQLENGKPSKQHKQNEISDEASDLQSKSKNLVEDYMKKDKPTIGNNTKDSSHPAVTESTISTSAEDTEGKSATEQGPNETGAKFPSKSGDSDKVVTTTNMEGDTEKDTSKQ